MQDRFLETSHLPGEPWIAVQWVAVAGKPVEQGLVLPGGQGDAGIGLAVGELRRRRALAGLTAESTVAADHQGGQRLGDLRAGGRVVAAGAQDDDGVLALALVLDISHFGDHRECACGRQWRREPDLLRAVQ